MDVIELKNYILDNNLVADILESIGCHSISYHDGYWKCANKDGDNKQAVTVYENDNLTCIDYTRNITRNKRTADLFDLVVYNMDCIFPEALKFVCEQIGLDYYGDAIEPPKSLVILQMIYDMAKYGDNTDDLSNLKPIPEKILSYYLPYGNRLFAQDNISFEVQSEFEIGYDPCSNRITIPIRDSIGTLVGVKGRLFSEDVLFDESPKYLYIEKCNKGKILYGYYENRQFIKNHKYVYVVESEKAVLQLASYGVRNCVATGGKTISKYQVELLVRIGCSPILAYDKDVQYDELTDIASIFPRGTDVFAIYDQNDILDNKESPSDDPDKFFELQEKYIVKLDKHETIEQA